MLTAESKQIHLNFESEENFMTSISLIELVELFGDFFNEDITVTVHGKKYLLDITNSECGVMNCLLDTRKEFYGHAEFENRINNLQEEIKARNVKRREESDREYEKYLENYWYEEHCETVCGY